MLSEPRLIYRGERPYAAIRAQVTLQDFPATIDAALPEAFGYLASQGIPPEGPPLIRYHVIDMASKMDVAIGVPTPTPITGNGRVLGDVLPSGRYATILYTGAYSGLMDANAVLLDWTTQRGLVLDQQATDHGDAFGGRVEFYLTDPRLEPDQSRWETEVAIRLADEQPAHPAS